MKTAYICSPYRGAVAQNVEYAKHLTRLAVQLGYAPITPHLYLTQCLDDDNPVHREQGLQIGLELLRVCDVVIVGVKHGISVGMKNEIEAAVKAGKDMFQIYDKVAACLIG